MKKKLQVFAVFVLFSVSLMAQSGNSRTASVGVTLSPFEDTDVFLTPYFINGRYFLDGFAARLGVGTSMLFTSDQEDDASSVKNSALFEIRPGAEYHIGASADVIPFVGVDFIYAMQRNNMNASVGAPIDGAWSVDDFDGHRGYNAFGFNLVAGGDYFIKGGSVYVGTEIGLEFISYSYSEVTWNEEVVIPKTKMQQFGFTLNSAIRVGVAF